jgi:hypothetical protein
MAASAMARSCREDVLKLGHIITTESAGFNGVNEIAVV